PLQPVAVARGASGQRFHQLAQAGRGLTGCQQQVHMVGHQAIGINLHTEGVLELTEIRQVALIILIGREDNLTVVAALDHMMRVVRQHDTSHPGHDSSSILGRVSLAGKINLSPFSSTATARSWSSSTTVSWSPWMVMPRPRTSWPMPKPLISTLCRHSNRRLEQLHGSHVERGSLATVGWIA